MSAHLVPYAPSMREELREIFFESSTKKDFPDEASRENFFHKYLGFYLEQYPDLTWVAQGDRILGYVAAAPHSSSPELNKLQPHLEVFTEHIHKFPAHLHINCHAESRGQGIGGKLISKIEEELKARNINGLHIMTGPDSLNKNFYRKLGFTYELMGNFQGSAILFMGKVL